MDGGPDGCLQCTLNNKQCLTIPQYFNGEPVATVALHDAVESALPALVHRGSFPGTNDARNEARSRHVQDVDSFIKVVERAWVPVGSLKRKQDFD